MLLQQLRQVLTAPPATIQSDHTKETRNRGTDRSDGRPENIKEPIFSLFRDKRTRAPTPSAEAYLPTSGGPAGGLTCGEMALAGEKQASVPCRPSMAARGGGPGRGWGRARVPIGGKPGRYGREEEEEERMERVCVFIAVCIVFFSRCGWQYPFLGKSRQNPPPGTTCCVAAAYLCALLSSPLSLLSCAASALRAYKPLPPRATAGRMRINLLAIFCFWVGLPVLLGLLRHMADGSVCPHLFLKLYYVAPLFHWLRDRNRVNQLLIQYAYGGI